MNMKRMRGRNHRPNGGGGGGGGFRNQQNGIPLNRNHVFDSSGPEMRVRGTAQQLYEKYIQLARDASSNGDRVTGEAYYQHAEHYFRIISAINQAQGTPNAPQNGQQGYQSNGEYRRDGNNDGNSEGEPRQAEPRPQEHRQYEPRENGQQRHQEPRGEQQNRNQEPRAEYQNRNQEPRGENQNRQEPRRFEPRQDRRFEQRPRHEAPVADARIDISQALEAELAATIAPPAPAPAPAPAGFGEQPSLLELGTPEPRAIPINPAAPPVIAPRIPRPRGRPRVVKPAEEAGAED
jgi:hypothetical protein